MNGALLPSSASCPWARGSVHSLPPSGGTTHYTYTYRPVRPAVPWYVVEHRVHHPLEAPPGAVGRDVAHHREVGRHVGAVVVVARPTLHPLLAPHLQRQKPVKYNNPRFTVHTTKGSLTYSVRNQHKKHYSSVEVVFYWVLIPSTWNLGFKQSFLETVDLGLVYTQCHHHRFCEQRH